MAVRELTVVSKRNHCFAQFIDAFLWIGDARGRLRLVDISSVTPLETQPPLRACLEQLVTESSAPIDALVPEPLPPSVVASPARVWALVRGGTALCMNWRDTREALRASPSAGTSIATMAFTKWSSPGLAGQKIGGFAVARPRVMPLFPDYFMGPDGSGEGSGEEDESRDTVSCPPMLVVAGEDPFLAMYSQQQVCVCLFVVLKAVGGCAGWNAPHGGVLVSSLGNVTGRVYTDTLQVSIVPILIADDNAFLRGSGGPRLWLWLGLGWWGGGTWRVRGTSHWCVGIFGARAKNWSV